MIIEKTKKQFESVLSGGESEVILPEIMIPDEVEKFLKEKGLELLEIRRNGWQHDFRIDFKNKDDKIFVFSGSWYYGGCFFSRKDE